MTTMGFLPSAQGLLKHEARLRHRALKGVDQQQGAVGHTQHALDLAAKVGVARGVDDVDLNVLVLDRNVLGENRNAALALLVVGIQDAVLDLLVGTEGVRGTQEHLSTIVVLPWSTWAIIAILRSFCIKVYFVLQR